MAWMRRIRTGASTRLNPYFQTRHRKRLTQLVVVRAGGAGVLCAALAWLILYSPYTRIQFVEVTGASAETAPAITASIESLLEGRRLFIISRNHRWLYGDVWLEQQLLSRFPLNEAHAEQSQGTLRVSVEEKTRTFYLVQDDKMFALDRMGMALQELDDVERARVTVESEQGSSFPILYDKRGEEGSKERLSSEGLESLVSLFDAISSRTMLTPRSLTLSDEQGRVDVATDAGVTLYMTLQRPIDLQLSKLESLLEQDLIHVADLTYIDLRFTHRVFYH